MFKLDRECAMVGGICMNVDDCDPEYLSTTKGLCPTNAVHNVECCYRCKDHLVIRPLIDEINQKIFPSLRRQTT